MYRISTKNFRQARHRSQLQFYSVSCPEALPIALAVSPGFLRSPNPAPLRAGHNDVLEFIMQSCCHDHEIADQCSVICKRRERKLSAEEFCRRRPSLMIPFFCFAVVLKGFESLQ